MNAAGLREDEQTDRLLAATGRVRGYVAGAGPSVASRHVGDASDRARRQAVVDRNHVTETGTPDAQPMVFAHGYGCDQHMWRHVTPAFDDFRVVCFDHVGAGRSDVSAYDTNRYASLDGYATDVLEICDALDLQDVIFVGHSVSAMVGVLAANREPERFASLVLVCPSPRYLDDDGYVGGFSEPDIEELLAAVDGNYLGWAQAMAPVIVGNADRPELGAELAASFCRADPEIAKHFGRVTFLADNRDDLARVTVPTLVLQCREDVIAPPDVGQYVHDRIASSELVLLDATGHCPNLSAPRETAEAIARFVRR